MKKIPAQLPREPEDNMHGTDHQRIVEANIDLAESELTVRFMLNLDDVSAFINALRD